MVTIRLQRVGRKNHAEFRVVVTESARGPKSAKYLEVVGHHNPHTNTTVINAELVREWIKKGAQVSDTVHNLLIAKKVIEGKKKNVLPKKTPIKKEDEKKG
jgi:small subunit ribosomal protein S16